MNFFTVPFTMLFSTVFYVATGVSDCGCPIYDKAVCMYIAFWNFSDSSPNSDSVADSMMFIMILHSKFTGPFSGLTSVIGVLFLVLRPRKIST